MKAEKWGEEEEGGDEDCKEKAAAAAALVTQLATALVCSALPCHSKLSSSCYESSAVVKVTSYLDWGKKIFTFKRCLFKCWPQPEACMCSQYIACVTEGISSLAVQLWQMHFHFLQYGLQTLSVLYITLRVFSDVAGMKMKDSNDTSWNIHNNAV